ncbi:G2/mitotic-specific cyclin-A-like [Drosophila tropicalis]|uniref:G2/mitotic-specific cyclin-A-like n=1 Tax=Drosophila tropicalis TaxID=46794 RepID=UPI0035AC1ACE
MQNLKEQRNLEAEKENVFPIGARPMLASLKANSIGGPRQPLRVLNTITNQIQNVPKPLGGNIVNSVACNEKTKPELTGAVTLMDTDEDDCVPMNLSDAFSPMSIDTSQLSDDLASPPKAKELEQFFEVVEYQKDILNSLKNSETKHIINPLYMSRQKEITHRMRSLLIDWLVDVNEEYKMSTETLYLTVSFIDRFLSLASVTIKNLQLVGIAAMSIASKLEDIYAPDVPSLIAITNNTYTKRQMFKIEKVMLNVLNFDLCTSTACAFVNAYSVMSQSSEKLTYLSLFLCELTLIEGKTYLHFLPSLISAAALALARHILGLEIWTSQLMEITSYCLDDLRTLILHLCETHKLSKNSSKLWAIQNKYSTSKYQKVASIEAIELTEKDLDELSLASLCVFLTPLKNSTLK